MAYILLVDSDEVAKRSLKGILATRQHRFAAVGSVAEAWDFIRRVGKVDLVVLELKLKDGDGLALLEQLKADVCLKILPVVVYAAKADRDAVRAALTLRAQNFLLKPYRDDALFAELAKVEARPWREALFVKEETVCQARRVTPERLREVFEELRGALVDAGRALQPLAEEHATEPLAQAVKKLLAKAIEVGGRGPLAYLQAVEAKLAAGDWSGVKESLGALEFAARLIYLHLNPEECPEDYLTNEEIDKEQEEQARAFWATAPKEDRCPVIGWSQLKRELDALSGCPVIDSIAASFQMSANGHPTSLAPLLDLVQKDAGLTAEVLIAANRLKKGKGEGDTLPIEEPRMAVGLLGELRLATLGGGLDAVEERLMLAPPQFSWPNFRMFQLATAGLARWACGYLEMSSLEAPAYTAGLLHDLGKLLLARLHPFALQAMYEHALERGTRLASAERYFMEATTHEMAAYFAEKQGLPKRFANVMRWLDSPEDAVDDAELVAVVSLARDLCRHNHVGFSGDTPLDDAVPLEETAEWRILRSRVFLNFDLKKFERQAHLECQQLKRELAGKLFK